jgi:phenylalanyl-tRNA synthetase beta chain
MSVMRTTLLGGLLAAIRYNANRKLPRVRVFEVGRVFLRDPAVEDGPLSVAGLTQPMRVAGAAWGAIVDEQWGVPARHVDFHDVKGDVESLLAPLSARFEAAVHPALHPGRSARVVIDGSAAGWIGELHPRWQQSFGIPSPVVVFELDAEPLQARGLPELKEISKLPGLRRDMAVLVDDGIAVGAMLDRLREGLPQIVENVEVFDVYRGKGVENGKRSLAFRVLMQDTRRTLTDADADEVVATALSLLEQSFGAKLRT